MARTATTSRLIATLLPPESRLNSLLHLLQLHPTPSTLNQLSESLQRSAARQCKLIEQHDCHATLIFQS